MRNYLSAVPALINYYSWLGLFLLISNFSFMIHSTSNKEHNLEYYKYDMGRKLWTSFAIIVKNEGRNYYNTYIEEFVRENRKNFPETDLINDRSDSDIRVSFRSNLFLFLFFFNNLYLLDFSIIISIAQWLLALNMRNHRSFVTMIFVWIITIIAFIIANVSLSDILFTFIHNRLTNACYAIQIVGLRHLLRFLHLGVFYCAKVYAPGILIHWSFNNFLLLRL